MATGYSGGGKAIRVDMIRKLVIIAVGGKIGKPSPLKFLQLSEREWLE